jgi:hypothetical protein
VRERERERERGSIGEVWIELRRLLRQTLGWVLAYSSATLGWPPTRSLLPPEREREKRGKNERGDLWMMGINPVFLFLFS